MIGIKLSPVFFCGSCIRFFNVFMHGRFGDPHQLADLVDPVFALVVQFDN